jgi:hypothetical protein
MESVWNAEIATLSIKQEKKKTRGHRKEYWEGPNSP